jgi:hypothetical protein
VFHCSLPHPARVTLTVRDLLGRSVAVLRNEERAAGALDIPFQTGTLPAGVYRYQFQYDGNIVHGSMMVLR